MALSGRCGYIQKNKSRCRDNLKTQSRGKIPRLHPNKIQKMFRDTLIAVSVQRIHALLVTDNLTDFEAIRRYCKVRIKSGTDFFEPGRMGGNPSFGLDDTT